MTNYRPTPKRLIVGPVTSYGGMMHDAEGNHILDVRGHGRMQYYQGAEAIEEKVEQWLVDAVNERLKTHPI